MTEPVAPVAGETQADVDPFGIVRRASPKIAWPVLAAVCAGGVVGSLAPYGLIDAFPHGPGGFAWTTFAINVSGCFLIGVLMVLISEIWQSRRLLRPFWGTGVLGGFTTFSAYILDTQHLLGAGAAHIALAYLAGTLMAALAAVVAGDAVTRWVVQRLHQHGEIA